MIIKSFEAIVLALILNWFYLETQKRVLNALNRLNTPQVSCDWFVIAMNNILLRDRYIFCWIFLSVSRWACIQCFDLLIKPRDRLAQNIHRFDQIQWEIHKYFWFCCLFFQTRNIRCLSNAEASTTLVRSQLWHVGKNLVSTIDLCNVMDRHCGPPLHQWNRKTNMHFKKRLHM